MRWLRSRGEAGCAWILSLRGQPQVHSWDCLRTGHPQSSLGYFQPGGFSQSLAMLTRATYRAGLLVQRSMKAVFSGGWASIRREPGTHSRTRVDKQGIAYRQPPSYRVDAEWAASAAASQVCRQTREGPFPQPRGRGVSWGLRCSKPL